ncbi:zinc-dependent metalloprotease [Actinokineospora globicatena]|uniref:zinc-dependent metalloprotease n=1 Tax=Actinokineospora globicatena TaxID=103729 RepID=UPI0020A26460|nr:zinc-dependent metalloprotease [Actinokineospora globicatena]MCP2304967.1 putative hydrolase [Actinokineospora globicatena]GLW80427.1 hydrolase [Actinokineospora globicatena]GLW87255.1 hydrolase [Actinokineospora globicatena]
MNEFPFGFNMPNPDDPDRGKQGGDGQENPFDQLGQMLSQLGQMMSQASTSSGPVNYDLAKQIAVQKLAGQIGFTAPAEAHTAVTDAVHLAEMWLDPVTTLPAGATSTKAWTAKDWVEHTLPTWQRLCDPVAKRMAGAWVEALPAEAKAQAGPLLAMVGQMGGMAFGSQLGNALAQLGSEVLTVTDIGLPLGPDATAALLPANIEEFTKGLERPASEVMVFIAAREAAHQRLFAHVPWLRQRLLGAVEEFANGIKVDISALEELATQVDPANPATIEQAMQSGMLEPKTTPEQQAALARLETLLALVEGWVDLVVGEAVTDRLPGADALRETMRRRRASGGPAEQTFATLVGLELRPRRLRAATALWRMITDQHGMTTRDGLWAHPDLMPTAEDLDEPIDFTQRLGATPADDPIAQLERTEQSERAADEDKPEEDKTGDDK